MWGYHHKQHGRCQSSSPQTSKVQLLVLICFLSTVSAFPLTITPSFVALGRVHQIRDQYQRTRTALPPIMTALRLASKEEDMELTRQVLLQARSNVDATDESLVAAEKGEEGDESYEYIEDEGAFVVEEADDDDDDDDDAYLNYSAEVSSNAGGLKPLPPPIPPMVDEQLENDLMQAERRIQLYEMEIEMMREQVNLKTEELESEQNRFRDEKNSFMSKIAEFTNVLAQRDEEINNINKKNNDDKKSTAADDANMLKEKQEALQKEVETLQEELKKKTQAYEEELKKTSELKKRYEDANDALEFEQMAFTKEKQALQDAIDGEKKNVVSLETKLEEVQSNFESIRSKLAEKLEMETEKLSTTQSSLQETKAELAKTQQEMKESLKEKEASLKETQRELRSQRELSQEEKDELKKKINAEQFIVKNVRQELKEEKDKFEKSRKELENAIAKERKSVKDLQGEMVRQQSKFESERSTIENRISEEVARLAKVEAELSNERDRYTKMKEKLEFKLAEEIRNRQLKKRQMNERYTEIRREMTDLWQSTRRDARKEQERLTNKYERKLQDVKKQVARLSGDIDESELSGMKIEQLLSRAEENQNRIIAESQAMETRYKETLKERDTMINNLKINVSSLQKVVVEKDAIIEEQQERLGKYETSFRALAKLSLTVTGNKLKGRGRKKIQADLPQSEDTESN